MRRRHAVVLTILALVALALVAHAANLAVIGAGVLVAPTGSPAFQPYIE